MSYNVVSLNFGGGVDTKTDPKMVIPAKLTLLQDCVFTNFRRLTKRRGTIPMSLNIVGGGTITSPTMVKSYRNELVCAGTATGAFVSGQRLFAYSPDLSAWSDCGKYLSVKVSKQVIAAPINGAVNCSSATISSITVYGYEQPTFTSGSLPFGPSPVWWIVQDNTTGQTIASGQIVSAYGFTWGFGKIVALSSTRFAIFYISDTSSVSPTAPELFLQTITVTSGGGVILGAETLVTPAFRTTGSASGANCYAYDVVSTPGGCIVAACAPNGIHREVYIATYNTAGVFQNSTTATTGTFSPSIINIVLDPSSTNAWIYWYATAADTINYAIFNASSLAVVLNTTTIATVSNVQQLTALAVDATDQISYWSTWAQPASGSTIGVYYPSITSATTNTAGTTGSPATFKNGIDIYAKPFSLGGRNYLPCVNLSQSQSSGFIVDLSDGIAIAKFLQTEAEGIYEQGFDTGGPTYDAPTPIAVRFPSFLNPATLLSSEIVLLAAGFYVSLTEAVLSSTSNKAAFPEVVTTAATIAVSSIQFDFDNIDSYQAVVQQDTLALNGGLIEQYDGYSVTELGFSIDPDAVSLTASAATGAMGSGTFLYYAVYQWTDANGNLHQSAPSLAAAIVFTSGTTNSVQITVQPLTLTQKTNVIINIYRTISDGTIAYLVGALINGSSYNSIGLTDTTSDAEIQGFPTMYTEGDSILSNVAPPPSMIMWTNNNRLWCVDSENPETTIEYSKTASLGSGIAFSTGQLELIMDSRFGNITGASPMDEKTVILKQSGIFYFIGDGSNDAGTGSTISNPQIVPSDSGCSNSKSVILFPGGILFRANNDKGIYIFSRGVQVQFFGLDVNSYSTQDVQAASYDSNRNQIRLLTSNGFSLLYDYVMQQWSVFSNYQGLSSDISPASVGGTYTYVRTDGSIYQEDLGTTYLDNTTPFSPLVQLSWIKAQNIQGFSRLRRAMLLGDFSVANNGHGVQISVAYDFQPSFSPLASYTFQTNGSTLPYQYRERLPRQKCDAVQFQIQELVTGAAGEYIDFSDLGIEIQPKQGLNKLPASQTVG